MISASALDWGARTCEAYCSQKLGVACAATCTLEDGTRAAGLLSAYNPVKVQNDETKAATCADPLSMPAVSASNLASSVDCCCVMPAKVQVEARENATCSEVCAAANVRCGKDTARGQVVVEPNVGDGTSFGALEQPCSASYTKCDDKLELPKNCKATGTRIFSCDCEDAPP